MKIEELQSRNKPLEIELNKVKKINEELKIENNKLKEQNKDKIIIIDEGKRIIEELNKKIIQLQNIGKINPNYDKIMNLMEKLEKKENELKDLKSKLHLNYLKMKN